jgi:hypothetical protein
MAERSQQSGVAQDWKGGIDRIADLELAVSALRTAQ